MAEKQPDFVVSDRRRFGSEGERRPDAQVAEEEKAATPPSANPAAPAPQATQPPTQPAATTPEASAEPAVPAQGEEMPEPPSAEEQQQQSDAYKASGKKIDEMIAAAGRGGQGPMEMNFERVVESFYMSALIQMGALRTNDNEPPRVDIIGARQTIDSLTVLQEKTKGNLTDREKTLMQNVLFELRMAWIEITNAVASSATKPGAVPPVEKK